MQITIPESAKCPQCGTQAHNGKSVMQLFGVRFSPDGTCMTQSQCKKCRKIVLKGKYKEKYDSIKKTLMELRHQKTLKVIEDSKPKYDKVKAEAKKLLDEKWEIIKNEEKSLKDQIEAEYQKALSEKKEAILKEMAK